MLLFGFDGFTIIFYAIFILALALIIFGIFRGIRQWSCNNRSPRLTVQATVAAKRTQVSAHHHNMGNGVMNLSQSTTYYVTFQVESGDRLELCVGGREYGQLAEGDVGRLTFQGTRYLGFDRTGEVS